MSRDAPRRALLAWESGGGRGHIVNLKLAAQSLRGRFVFDAAICQRQFASELAPLCERIIGGPRLMDAPDQRVRRKHGPPSWAEYLGDFGFDLPPLISRHVKWWQDRLQEASYDLVVAEYAPCAIMAARSLGIPCVAIGQGFGMPPAEMPRYPVLFPDFTDFLYEEADLVALVNEAVVPLGVPELTALPQIYACDDQLANTIALLDPYAAERAAPYLPLPETARDRTGGGDEVFAYFSTAYALNDQIIEALCGCGLKLRAYMPGASEDRKARLAAAGVIVEPKPVAEPEIRRRSRLVVNVGQHGSIMFGLTAGLPQVAVPMHVEQLFNARRVAATGAIRVVERARRSDAAFMTSMIREAYEDGTMRDCAARLAETVEPGLGDNIEAAISARVIRVLEKRDEA